MGDGNARMWIHEAQHHVGTAQMVLDEVGRGLATVERAEDAAERVVPIVRTVVLVTLGCAVGLGIYLLTARRRPRPTDDPIERDPTPSATGPID